MAESPPVPTVLRNGRIYTPAGADLTAMVVDGATIAWMGTEEGVSVHLDSVDEVIDLDGALVTPAFVDAHVHCTDLGRSLRGLDLHGVRSRAELLDRVVAHARTDSAPVVIGEGWDDTLWTDAQLPSAAELDRAGGGRPVYLSRVDAHSALVSSALLGPDVLGRPGYRPDGWLTGVAHDAARTAALGRRGDADRAAAQVAALEHAAAMGIGCVHEMGGPTISSAADLGELLALGPGRIEVIGYWAELNGIATAQALGAAGAAGDLFCDGSIGSHTASLSAPYSDDSSRSPKPRLTVEEVAEHVAACTTAGLQAGFHAIGDAAVDTVLDGFDRAAARLGPSVRTAGHRLEHVEMVSDPRRFAASGITASVQPAFDSTWGGTDGLYERRLGRDRARTMNDFSSLISAGTALAFGSDAPVTPLNPWGAVRAAAYHHNPESSISVRAAFAAHTRGGWRAARRDGDGSGVLDVGAPATFAVWDTGDLVIDVPDERVSRWSTDPRAAVAGLPDISPGRDLPTCRRTVVRGVVVHDSAR